jgi:hypothetical protein
MRRVAKSKLYILREKGHHPGMKHKPKNPDDVQKAGRQAAGCKRKPRTAKPKPAEPPPDAELPYWLWGEGLWGRLPKGVQKAAIEVIKPAYRHMVLEAQSELERSAGITLVHLLWVEVCDQFAMAGVVADRQWIVSMLSKPEEMIQHHLHLVHAKQQATEMVLKLQAFARLLAQQDQPAPPLTLDCATVGK